MCKIVLHQSPRFGQPVDFDWHITFEQETFVGLYFYCSHDQELFLLIICVVPLVRIPPPTQEP